jgi:hypothetical protein
MPTSMLEILTITIDNELRPLSVASVYMDKN